MRNRFDHLAKQIGRQALGRSGVTTSNHEIAPETQHADLRHEPNPDRQAERDKLGLLGRFASLPCLMEVYGHAPTAEEFRACLAKHLAYWRQRSRAVRRQKSLKRGSIARPREDPFLWILAAGSPAALLAKLKPVPRPGWPSGVTFLGEEVLRTAFVVGPDLPRDRSTILVRLMTAGPLLGGAVQDLAKLPPDAHERFVAEQILLNMQHALQQKPVRTSEEEDFIMTMHSTWEDARQSGRLEGRSEGRLEGRSEGLALSVIEVLEARNIAVSDDVRRRIVAENSDVVLRRWLTRAATAASLADILT